jgi:hypothetical protein
MLETNQIRNVSNDPAWRESQILKNSFFEKKRRKFKWKNFNLKKGVEMELLVSPLKFVFN